MTLTTLIYLHKSLFPGLVIQMFHWVLNILYISYYAYIAHQFTLQCNLIVSPFGSLACWGNCGYNWFKGKWNLSGIVKAIALWKLIFKWFYHNWISRLHLNWKFNINCAPGPCWNCFSNRVPSYQYINSHRKDMMVSQLSYLILGIPIIRKESFILKQYPCSNTEAGISCDLILTPSTRSCEETQLDQ